LNFSLFGGRLNHIDLRVTEEHYNRASSVSASKKYARINADFLLTEGNLQSKRGFQLPQP